MAVSHFATTIFVAKRCGKILGEFLERESKNSPNRRSEGVGRVV